MFTHTCNLFVLIRTANSTRWPGVSRWAFRILILAGFNTIALLSINIAVYVGLVRLGASAVCRDASGSFTDIRPLPVTYTATHSTDSIQHASTYLSIHSNLEKSMLIFTCFISPALILLMLLLLIGLHFRRLTNRQGMLASFVTVPMFVMQSLYNYGMDVDTRKIHTEYAPCWTTPALMQVLLSQARGRRGLAVAAEFLGYVGATCCAFYFILALIAAGLNRNAGRQQDVRLQNLRRDSDARPAEGSGEVVPPANAAGEVVAPANGSGEVVPPANAPVEPVVPAAGAKQEEGVIRVPHEAHVNPFADPEREAGMGGEWEENVLRISATTRQAQRWDLFA